jgi:acyl-[acyl-carrier-protein]-phospholipid O-acyltransferase/long-chain-fatty-acid--[acyl-carrier-protein] ligase
MKDHTLPPTQPSLQAMEPGSGTFRTLLVVRILTVLNDNLARWLVIGLGKHAAEQVGSSAAAVLTIGTIVYVLPFILLAWLSGWLGDRLAKRTVVVAGKFAEIGIAVATASIAAWGAGSGVVIAGIPLGLWLLMGSTGLFAVQTTLLNPSLIGTIPETVPREKLSSANGIFAMASLAATLVGMALGNWLADITWVPTGTAPAAVGWPASVPFVNALPAAAALLGVAVLGWLMSLRLPAIPPADPTAPPPWNLLAKTLDDMRRLAASPQLAGAAAGIVVFWGVAAVAQLNVDQYAVESGATTQTEVVPLLISLVSGIGLGSLIAGRYSTRGIDPGSKVDLGFVPLGAALMAVACFALALSGSEIFSGGSPTLQLVVPVVCLLLLGVGAGMFDVPLEASMQEKSPPGRLAAVLASTNLLVFAGMLLASVGYYGLRVPVGEGDQAGPLFSARGVFALFGLLSLAELAVAVYAAPRATLRLFVKMLVHLRYRFEVRHDERVPEEGPLVVIANHISWLDGFVAVLACPRPIRMVVFGPNIRGRFLKMLADQWRFILFDPKPKSIGRALKTMQAGLAEGDCIGIFCEGGISRTGQILPFKRGLDWIFDRIEAPMIPLSIDGMWGSVLSFSGGTTLSRWPRGLRRRRLTLSYGPRLPAGTPTAIARIGLQEQAAHAVRFRMVETRSAASDITGWCRRFRREVVAVDAAGRPRTGNDVLGEWGGAGLSLRSTVDVDWAALAATAEAFDGACMIRRSDLLVSTVSGVHPLADALGRYAGALLGIRAIWGEQRLSPYEIAEVLSCGPANIWVAELPQLVAVAAESSPRLPASLEVIVVPLTDAGEVAEFEAVAAACLERHGIMPVAGFAPAGSGGLLAMNTPPCRNVSPHEMTSKAGTLGRVLNGSVVWPTAAARRVLGFSETPEVAAVDGGLPLALGAGFVARRRNATDLAPLPLPGIVVDHDGFLLPSTAANVPAIDSLGQETS